MFTLLKTSCLKFVRQFEDVLVLEGVCVLINKAPCQPHLHNRNHIQRVDQSSPLSDSHCLSHTPFRPMVSQIPEPVHD